MDRLRTHAALNVAYLALASFVACGRFGPNPIG
jgi:hypothetical protein